MAKIDLQPQQIPTRQSVGNLDDGDLFMRGNGHYLVLPDRYKDCTYLQLATMRMISLGDDELVERLPKGAKIHFTLEQES